MQKRARSILDELDTLLVQKDRENIVESRATHIIQGAINLMSMIREAYDEDTADELERRLINSIRGKDATKFVRGIRNIRESMNSDLNNPKA